MHSSQSPTCLSESQQDAPLPGGSQPLPHSSAAVPMLRPQLSHTLLQPITESPPDTPTHEEVDSPHANGDSGSSDDFDFYTLKIPPGYVLPPNLRF